MKKLAAIFFLCVLLFNLVGYKLLFSFADDSLNKQAAISFDNNDYDESATVTIKVPLNIPYQTEQIHFVRADGKINIDGKVYRYIKRKIVNNEMIFVCIADNKATNLNKNKTDFFQTTSGLFNNSNNKKSTTSGSDFFKLLPVYNNGFTLSYNFSLHKIFKVNNTTNSFSKLLTNAKEPPAQPPEFS